MNVKVAYLVLKGYYPSETILGCFPTRKDAETFKGSSNLRIQSTHLVFAQGAWRRVNSTPMSFDAGLFANYPDSTLRTNPRNYNSFLHPKLVMQPTPQEPQ